MKQQDLKQESFEAWFAKQHGNRQFRFEDPCNCMIACWVKETDLAPNPSCGPGYVRQDVDFDSKRILFPQWLWAIEQEVVSLERPMGTPFTVGQLRKARAIA